MPVTIEIRNVSDEVHRLLEARASRAGLSMSAYLLREIEKLVQRPTRQEVLERIAALPAVAPESAAADVLRRERDER